MSTCVMNHVSATNTIEPVDFIGGEAQARGTIFIMKRRSAPIVKFQLVIQRSPWIIQKYRGSPVCEQ
jgi:hypothetical protein